MSRTIYEVEGEWNKVHEAFSELEAYVLDAVEAGKDLHVVEGGLFKGLLALGRRLMKAYVVGSGTGYSPGQPPRTLDGRALKYGGINSVAYLSIFGQLDLPRAVYAHPEGGCVCPMDARWNRPASKYSYLLQDWLQGCASEDDFRQAVGVLNKILGLNLTPNVAKRLTLDLAEYTEPFDEQAPLPEADTEGSHLGLAVDCKGVRILRRDRPGAFPVVPKPRRGKGEKPGIKKDAVVTADFSFNPEERDPDEMVRLLMKRLTEEEREQQRQDRRDRRKKGVPLPREPLNLHAWVTMEGKEKAFARLTDRIHRRDPEGGKPLVAVMDGDPALEQRLCNALEEAKLLDRLEAVIADIWHVAGYLWATGTALYGEKSPKRDEWVEEKLRALLSRPPGRVLGGLRQIRTKRRLRQAQKAALDKAITYLHNHQHMIDYATYLAKGYPIGSGLVEGLCNSLVNDRMEQSGMRWSVRGAEAMLRQRATYKNGDWDAFCAFRIDSERQRLYSETLKTAA
jgi:hypothetical protein